MKYFALLTEVAGHLKPDSAKQESNSTHLVLDDSFSDCLISATCTYFITDTLKQELEKLQVTGATIGDVQVSYSDQYQDNTRNKRDWVVPHLSWLIVGGTAGTDDFGMLPSTYTLIVSHRVLNVIQNVGVSFCMVKEYLPDQSYDFWGPFGRP